MLSLAGATMVFLAALFLLKHHVVQVDAPTFWDARTYTSAFQESLAHGDAYRHDRPFVFVYPPLFLHVGAFFYERLSGSITWVCSIGLNLLAMVVCPVVIAGVYLRSRWLTPPVAILLLAISPAFMAESAFFSGNLANLLYAMILLAGVDGVRRQKWTAFYVVLGGAALIKFPMLVCLLLPLMLGKGQWIASLATGTTVLLINLGSRLLNPKEFTAYLDAVQYQILIRHDVGYGAFATTFNVVNHQPGLPHLLPYGIHTAVASVLVMALWLARERGWPGLSAGQIVAVTLITALLCNPRLQPYDLDQLVVPIIFLLVETTICFVKISRLALAPLLLIFAALLALLSRFPLQATYAAAVYAVASVAAIGLFFSVRIEPSGGKIVPVESAA